jgi:hypothetical protein
LSDLALARLLPTTIEYSVRTVLLAKALKNPFGLREGVQARTLREVLPPPPASDFVAVRQYLRYTLNVRDFVEMMAKLGLSLAHMAILRTGVGLYARICQTLEPF